MAYFPQVSINDATTPTQTVGVDANGHLFVGGKSAVGSAPSSNPVYISGLDLSGFKRAILTDSAGRMQVSAPIGAAATYIPVQIGMTRNLTAVNNYEWQEILEYVVPTGYDLNCIMFESWSATANEKAKVVYKSAFGSYVCSTNTFTDGESWTAPKFASRMYVYVTTQIGSGSIDNVTVTYTNHLGTTGRTGTVALPKSALVGTRLEVDLQAGDYGILDVTNVTHSATGQAGAFNVEGNLGLFYLVLNTANTQYQNPSPGVGGIVVPQGGKVYLQYQANTAVASQRHINLVGALVPR